MRAVLYDRYGSPEVLRIGDQPPSTPKPNEVLVRVRAASLNPKDVMVRAGRFRMLTHGPFPRSCGYDFSGVVESVGPEVLHVTRGDAVFGMINGMLGRTCAELVIVDSNELVKKPASLTFEEAAAAPLVSLTALQALRDEGALQPGQQILINGASGGVGTMAVQIARLIGAEVLAVCSSKNEELVRALGAHQILPYDLGNPFIGLSGIDVFFDVFGNQSIHEVLGLLSDHGRYVTTVPKLRNFLDVIGTRWARRRAHLVLVRSNRHDLEEIARWLEEGRLRPVIDRVHELGEIAEAHRYVATKRARGKVVIRVA